MAMKRSYYNALKVIRRDGYSCKDCNIGFPINNLLVHHIDFDPENSKGNNLVTLCQRCHKKRHGLLAPKREDIVEMRSMGLTFQEIGERLDLSRQRVHFLYHKASN